MKTRVFAGVWAALFAVFVGLQYNDPDPLQWMAVYGAAAGVCLAYALGRRAPIPAGAVAAAALVWGVALIPGFAGKATPGDMFQSMKAERPEIELERESGGLFIVVGVMGLLALAGKAAAPASAPAPLPVEKE